MKKLRLDICYLVSWQVERSASPADLYIHREEVNSVCND